MGLDPDSGETRRGPALVLICDEDTVAPARAAVKAAERMPNAEVKHYPVGHFDVYRGEALYQSIEDQLDFLARFFKQIGARSD